MSATKDPNPTEGDQALLCWPTAPSRRHRFGASGHAVGEVCFNTAMTGYQRSDRSSYAGRSSPSPSRISACRTNEDDIGRQHGGERRAPAA